MDSNILDNIIEAAVQDSIDKSYSIEEDTISVWHKKVSDSYSHTLVLAFDDDAIFRNNLHMMKYNQEGKSKLRSQLQDFLRVLSSTLKSLGKVSDTRIVKSTNSLNKNESIEKDPWIDDHFRSDRKYLFIICGFTSNTTHQRVIYTLDSIGKLMRLLNDTNSRSIGIYLISKKPNKSIGEHDIIEWRCKKRDYMPADLDFSLEEVNSLNIAIWSSFPDLTLEESKKITKEVQKRIKKSDGRV